MTPLPAGGAIPPGLRTPPRNLVELLRARVEERPDRDLYRYLRGGEREEGPLTREALERRARGVAVRLRVYEGVETGDRALLLFPAGLDFLAGFFGCLHAGVIAVPAPPPDPVRMARTVSRLQAIVRNARPAVALTDPATLEAVQRMADQAPELAALRWVALDGGALDGLAEGWNEAWGDAGFDSLAYLQYTSGSTSSPKGVMVSHGNILLQGEVIRRAMGYSPESRSVVWVPNFHDDGLVQGILEPLYAGGELVLLSPLDVVQQPLRWLRAVSRYRGTHGGGPNFMYELCVRRVTPEQREGLDLSSWQMAYNGAEPIRQETVNRFHEAYAPYGLRREALWSAYGMAETTLLISTGSGPAGAPVVASDRAELEGRGRVRAAAPGVEARPIVSCGRVVDAMEVAIVHPERRVRCAPDEVGEIWTASPSNAHGYWEKPQDTEETFRARLADDRAAGPFLRTGDLGFFHAGELYVTGRYKDLVIVGGRNLYPQDVELTAERAHPAIRPGGGVAFSVDSDDGEALVVVQEVDPGKAAAGGGFEAVVEAVRAAVTEAHEAPIQAVVLIPHGGIPKTSSGKVQRRACKADFLNGTLETLAEWRRAPGVPAGRPAAPARRSAAEIETWLVERLARALAIDPAEVEMDRPFARHKLDSRVALVLSGELEEWLEVELSPTVFYEHPTLRELIGAVPHCRDAPWGVSAAGTPSKSPTPLPRAPGPVPAGLTGDLAPSGDREGSGRPLRPGDAPRGVSTVGDADAIALVGWSCRFPGAPDPAAYRRLLWDGIDAVRELPDERRRLGFLLGLDPEALPRRGGFLDEVDRFDAPFFEISPREAVTMDPQQRLLLEVAWEALESAGIDPAALAGTPAGVFVGISTNDYANLQVRLGDPAAVEPHMGTGTSHSIAANRISYFLGLRGPSLAVDTACSSSLVAVHLACRSLRSGESRLALAGGVNLILWPRESAIFTRAGMLSSDGRCKTFDAAADGYSRGEGCGVVVLKRLFDALADGDPVVAVIRGSAVNQDGFSSGLTAPNGEAQQEVVRAALADAGVTGAEIGYVEAHGTGTALGDPIEVRALGAVLGPGRPAGSRFRLGSAKTNLGHLEAAAGVAGLIKAALVLERGEIPPHLHLREVNPHISLDEAAAEIPTRLTPWPDSDGRRLAGVSSFGFGGTNAHVILETPPARPARVEEVEAVPSLFVLSARTPAALRSLARRFAEWLGERDAVLADVCYTAAAGRAALAVRLATVVESAGQLAERLRAFAEAGEAAGVVTGRAEGRERPWVPAVEPAAARDRAFLTTLRALWVRGGEVGWGSLYAGEARRRIAMPTYAFERRAYWLEVPAEAEGPHPPAPSPSRTPAPAGRGGEERLALEIAPGVETLLRMQVEALRDLAAMQMGFLAGGWTVESPLPVELRPSPLGGGGLEQGGGQEGGGRLGENAQDGLTRTGPPPVLPPVPTTPSPGGGTCSSLEEVKGSKVATGRPAPTLLPAPLPPFDLPLSEAQADLYTVAQVSPEARIAYNETGVLDLRGPLDLPSLRRALQAVVDRHESLRTVLPGGEVQRVLPPWPVPLPLLDASGLPATMRGAAVEVWLEGESRLPFDFERGPLLRCSVMRLDRRSHLLFLGAHHIVADGYSLAAIFLRELFAAYESLRGGVRPRLLPARQFRGYLAWLEEDEQQAALAAAEGYWLERFRGELPVFEPPTDRPRPAARSFRGARIRRIWEADLRGAVHGLGRRHRATFFVALFASYAALLHRWTGQDDIVTGVPLARRPSGEWGGDRLIGHCVDMVALRSRVTGGESFADYLTAVRRDAFDAQEHGAFPFARLLRAVRPPRDPSRGALVNNVFNLDQEVGASRSAGLEIAWKLPVVHYVKYDVTLHALETGGALILDLEYTAPLFDAATLERFHGHLRTLVESAIADPDRPLAELPILTAAERDQLAAWNRTDRPVPVETIHALIAAQVERTPNAVAVVGPEEESPAELTYRELEAAANRLARHLRGLGVGPEHRVAICLERGLDMAVAFLAVLKAGGAYVPLDPGYPRDRLALMLGDAGAAAIVTRGPLVEDLLAEAVWIVDLNRPETVRALTQESAAPPPAWTEPDGLAYVLYTSGSTGRPKGVAMSHRALANLVAWQIRSTPGAQRTAQFAPFSFDASFQEIACTWCAGGVLVLLPEEVRRDPAALLRRLDARRVERLFLPFVALQQLAEEARESGPPAALREVITAGEALQITPAVVALMERLGSLGGQPARLHNHYGPTEAHVVTFHILPGEPSSWPLLPPIGRPIDNDRVHVLDRAGQPVPAGVPGELYLGGTGLARGYLGRPDATAERFVPSPFDGPGARLYRTGDLGRLRADGELEFLGRIDHQVKIRGYRIEPGEIEAALAAHPEVREAIVAVTAVEGGSAGKRLVAFVIPAVPADLRDFLRSRLPEYMVPAAFVALAALPLTPSGKVDRRALAALETAGEEAAAAPADAEAPRGPAEELLAGIWAELLGHPRIPRDADFFDLGGHSLLGTRMMSRLRSALGVDLPLTVLFEAPTVAGLGGRIEEALRLQAGVESPPAIHRTGQRAGRPAPLSFAQQRLWFLSRFEPGSTVYNLPVAVRLAGLLRPDLLAAALAEIVRRHETLRTTFPEVDGEPVQAVAPAAGFALPWIDLAALPTTARAAEAARLEAEEGRRPFSLETGPLFRAFLHRLGPEEHTLLLSTHHIVSDGWSFGVLLDELAALYGALLAGRPSPLPELEIQYGDFAAWQRRWLAGGVLATLLAEARRRLTGGAGLPAVLDLPTDRPRPVVQTFRGRIEPFELSADLAAGVAGLSRGGGATLFMTLLAGFEALLHRYTGAAGFLVGTPIAHRNRAEVEGLIGFFVNTLPLRADLEGDLPFATLLDRTRAGALAAYAHQDLPFEKLVEDLAPERDLSRNPLAQVFFALQNAARPGRDLAPGLQARLDNVDTGISKFDLSLFFQEDGGRLMGGLEYSSALFDRRTALRALRQYRTLLEEAVAQPGARLADLPLLSDAERAELWAWSRSAPAIRSERTVPELFAACAAAAPDTPALLTDGGVWTYGDLDRGSAALARHLRRRGVRLDEPVGVYVERSPELILALLAVLRAGGAYLPLDPADPEERLRLLIADAGVRRILTRTGLADGLPGEKIFLDGFEDASADPLPAPDPDSLAYVLYTSGSTGKPKGVAVPHRAVTRLVAAPAEASFARLDASETLLQLAPVSFDASTLEIWGALANGGGLAVAPAGQLSVEEIGAAVERHGVTTLWLTAALFQQVADEQLPRLRSVRQLLAGGDVLPPAAVRRCLEELQGLRLINGYGPTENTTFTCTHAMTSPGEVESPVPIGRPVAGTDVWIVDPAFQPVPAGIPGELVTGGEGLARGYVGRPDLTAEWFVPHPFSPHLGERLYRTGDRARFRADGSIEFLGRLDAQVKIRGFRVEPAEAEAALARLPAVREAAVLALRGLGGLRLAAFFVSRDPAAVPSVVDLRAGLAATLPHYLIPSAFVAVPALPQTVSGKVDRRALERLGLPDLAAVSAPGEETARTPVEEVVAGAWCEVLERDRVGLRDHFFEIGGHSLLATRLLSRLRQALGVELSLKELFQDPTVAGLARQAERARQLRGGMAVPPIVRIPRGTPVRLSFSQERLWLAEQLQPGTYITSLPVTLTGPLEIPTLRRALTEIQRRHEVLRARFVVPDEAVESGPVQVVRPAADLDAWFLPIVDLGGLPEALHATEVRRLAVEEGHRPIDLARGPLFRACLVRETTGRHALFLTLHHAVCDAWSFDVLVQEIGPLYRAFSAGEPSPLPELPVQYADYAAWQREWLQGEVLESQLAFWRRHLGDSPPALDLATDRPRPPVVSTRGGALNLRLSPALRTGLEALGRRLGGSLFMTLLAVFQILLHRHTGQDRISVGTPVTGRNRAELEGLIGFFVNTLVLAADLADGPPAAAFLRKVRDVTLEAFDHQDLPFERLVAALEQGRDLSRQALFQVMFAFQATPVGGARRAELPGGLALEPVRTGGAGAVALFDQTLTATEQRGVLSLSLSYRADLFEMPTMARFLLQLERLLEGIVADPERPVAELPLLSESERHQVTAEWPERFDPAIAVLDRSGRPLPIGAWGEVWRAGAGTGEKARFQADGSLQPWSPPAAVSEAEPGSGAAEERRRAQLDQRRQQVSSRRGQLSADRQALLKKWIGGKPQEEGR
jgi:amino acid adenylation domain-containing protein